MAFLGLVGAATALSGCGSDAPDAVVTVAEWSMTMDVTTLERDRVLDARGTEGLRLDIVNEGELEHELVFARRGEFSGGTLPVGADGRVDEAQLVVIDRIPPVLPGLSESRIPVIQPDNYVVFCNLMSDEGLSHYQQGMWIEIEVTPKD